MPQIKLNIGPMSLEGDATSKGDAVLAHLYNGYLADSTDGSNAIHSLPGYVERCDLGTGTASVDGDFYSILHSVRITASAGRAWTVTTNYATTELVGVQLTAGTPVRFTEDETYIYFCAKSAINRLDPVAGLITQLTGQAPINCTHLAHLKGYLIAQGDDPTGLGLPGDVWHASSVGNYATWSVFNNMARPDAVSAVFATFKEIYAVGRETTEISYATTDPNAPFASNDGATQPFGTQSPYCVAFDQQSLYYPTTIGENRRICRLMGGREAQILSFSVDIPIDTPSSITDARGWIQSWKGQTYYVLNMPSTVMTINGLLHRGITLAFDIKLQRWQIWYKWDAVNGECNSYPADTFLYIEPLGKRFIGYRGKIYELTEDAAYFDTTPVRMMIRTGNRSWGTLKRKNSQFYQYNLKRGASLATAEPVMVHRWRNNQNAEWTNGRTVSLGTEGNRSIYRRSSQCGQYITRQDEFIFPDPGSYVFNSIEEEVEVLR